MRLPIVQEHIRLLVKGQSAHLYPRDLINLDIILPSKEIQEEIAKLNRDSQNEFVKKTKGAKRDLSKTRKEIEDRILNGKR